jgi:hypothetical protein
VWCSQFHDSEAVELGHTSGISGSGFSILFAVLHFLGQLLRMVLIFSCTFFVRTEDGLGS